MGKGSKPRKITKETVNNYRNNKFWEKVEKKENKK